MTNAAVVPAWMNWPGSTIFCTTVPAMRRAHRQLGPDGDVLLLGLGDVLLA